MKCKNPTAVILLFSVLFAALMIGLLIGRATNRRFLFAEEVKQMPQAQSTFRQININTATVQELAVLDGVSEELAQRIVNSRELRGGFSSADQLLKIDGFSAKLLESLRDMLAVE